MNNNCNHFEDLLPNFSGLSFFARGVRAASVFLKGVFFSPIYLFFRLIKSMQIVFLLCVAIGFIVITLGTNQGSRSYLREKVSDLSSDIVRWFFLPFDACTAMMRLICRFVLGKTTI